MPEEYLSEVMILLKQMFLFQSLDEQQLADLETKLERLSFESGQVIVEQGTLGEDFYIVLQGNAVVSQKDDLSSSIESESNIITTLGRGDYIGEESLLFDRPRSATVTAQGPLILLRMGYESFQEMIHTYPNIYIYFSATTESRKIAQREKFEWLGVDEVVYLITRKHEFFLLLSLVLPVLLSMACIPLILYSFSASSKGLMYLLLYGGGIILGVAILWGIWQYLDWENDFYIVTNKRVLWVEKVIGLYYSRREAPLMQVLTVDVTSSQVGRIIGYGNVDVRTYTGSILMQNMAHPGMFEDFLRGYHNTAQHRQRESDKGMMSATLKNSIAMQMAGKLPTRPIQQLPRPKPKPKPEKTNSIFQEIVATLFKMRYQKGDVITYRKHWFVLFWKIWQPSFTFLLLIVYSLYLIYRYNFLHLSFIMSGLSWGMFLFSGGIGVLLWWLYQYVDWSNDIYRITADQILDIEKKPLGKEEKKTASIDSILSIEHTRAGIIELIFNFGDVIVNVGQTQFTFNGVLNPDQVHQDISDRMETRARKKKEAEASRERERMSDWFSIYRDVTMSNDEE